VAAVHPEAAARLVARHGTEAPAVVALGGELDLLRPLVPGRPFLEAEVAWAVRHELALSVDDVLSRRLRLSPELADRGAVAAPRVAEIMGRELGWSASRRDLEAETYLASAPEEYGIAPSPTPLGSASEAMRTAAPVEGRIAG
jgi:glycerol-3-phosphate dehydrogenase